MLRANPLNNVRRPWTRQYAAPRMVACSYVI